MAKKKCSWICYKCLLKAIRGFMSNHIQEYLILHITQNKFLFFALNLLKFNSFIWVCTGTFNFMQMECLDSMTNLKWHTAVWNIDRSLETWLT